MRVDTAREQRDRHFSRAHGGEVACERETQPSETAGHIVVNCFLVKRGHLPRTNNHEVAQCLVVVLEEARSYSRCRKLPPSSVGGGDTRRQRTETVSRPEEPVMKEVNERGKARLPRRSTEAKNLDDDEQEIYQKLTQLNKVTKTYQDAKAHSQQQARRAYPTGESQKNRKSSANCRLKRMRRTMSRGSWAEGERQVCHKGEASEVRKKDLLKVINTLQQSKN